MKEIVQKLFERQGLLRVITETKKRIILTLLKYLLILYMCAMTISTLEQPVNPLIKCFISCLDYGPTLKLNHICEVFFLLFLGI